MLCALESTSNHEANKQILAIFPHDSQLSHYPIFVESLENVRFVKVSYGDLIRNCGRGMSELWDSGKLQASEFYHRSVFPVCTKIKTTRSFLLLAIWVTFWGSVCSFVLVDAIWTRMLWLWPIFRRIRGILSLSLGDPNCRVPCYNSRGDMDFWRAR